MRDNDILARQDESKLPGPMKGHALLETLVALGIAGIFLAAEARLGAMSNRHLALARRAFETARTRLENIPASLTACESAPAAGEIVIECTRDGYRVLYLTDER